MHILYGSQVRDEHLSDEQSNFIRRLRLDSGRTTISGESGMAGGSRRYKDFAAAQDWVTAFFEKGADEVLAYYADDFVWEDIEFGQTITTKEELYKAFVVFNNSGPESPFGVHTFEMISYDGGTVSRSKAETRKEGIPSGWNPADYHRLADNILIGSDFEYDEWGYMQWIWKATHNADFFGIPAKGKTTVTRGTTTQFYRAGKIVRCRTHWNFREFAIQLGLIPPPDEAWRNNPEMVA